MEKVDNINTTKAIHEDCFADGWA